MRAGTMGDAAAFSFYPGKNLGACGEAGAITTNDPGVAARVKVLRDHGQFKKYHHEVEGFNGRLDAIQAGILSAKLLRLSEWNQQRRDCAARYNELLADAEGIALPSEPSWSNAVYHLYVIRTSDRDSIIIHLKQAGIATGIHYPIPLHLQPAYRALHYRPGDFPATEAAATEIVSLPMFPQLASHQQVRIAEEVRLFTSTLSRKDAQVEAGSLETEERVA